MAEFIYHVFLISLNYILLNGSIRTIKPIYEPYGPKMCKELCNNLAFSFIYDAEKLSCDAIPWNTSTHVGHSLSDRFYMCKLNLGKKGNTTTTVAAERNICNRESEDENSLFHPTTRSRKLNHDNYNITLHQACEKGILCAVKHILANKLEDINSRGKGGRTPVMTAARNGQVAVFHFLVNKGCSLSVVDDYNDNVLHAACRNGNMNIIRHLIENEKQDIESVGAYGRTPVFKLATFGHRSAFVFFESKGCNLEAIDDHRNNILHLACRGDVPMVRYILSKNITNVGKESKGFRGRTPVLIAAVYGRKRVFDFLVNKGCNLNVISTDLCNVLHVASRGGNVGIVSYILGQHIVDIDSTDSEGRTPLLIAADMGRFLAMCLLEMNGCNMQAVDVNNNNILHLACLGGHIKVVKYILKANVLGINSREYRGRTPLMAAAEKGHIKLFYFLKSRGCSLKDKDKSGNTILHVACIGGHVRMVKYLLTYRDVHRMKELRNGHGRTPLQEADIRDYTTMVTLLKGRLKRKH